MFYRYINKDEVNDYELEHRRLSYKNLFYKDDSLILCNNIVKQYEHLELQSGNFEDEQGYEIDTIYQYYIIDDDTAKRMMELDEIVYYHNELDIYILGVTHYGTSWNYVLTNVELVESDNGWYGWYNAYYDGDDTND